MQKTKRVVYQLQKKQQGVNNGTNTTDYTDTSPYLRQKTLVQRAGTKPILYSQFQIPESSFYGESSN